jgi:flagellar protein FliS
MQSSPQSSYLEAQVLTATPQKQRLMLIEGAIRFARQTLQLWEEKHDELACDALTSCRNIIAELISSITIQEDDLTRRVAAIYVFIFQTIVEAQLKRSKKSLQDALDVLAIERETWQLLCEQMPEAPTPSSHGPGSRPQEILAPTSTSFTGSNLCGGSFSLEA